MSIVKWEKIPLRETACLATAICSPDDLLRPAISQRGDTYICCGYHARDAKQRTGSVRQLQGGPEQGTQWIEEGQAQRCERRQLSYLFKRA